MQTLEESGETMERDFLLALGISGNVFSDFREDKKESSQSVYYIL